MALKKYPLEVQPGHRLGSTLDFLGSSTGKSTGKYQVIQAVTFLGWLSDPFKWLSDLQLGDEKVTLNHLVFNDSIHFAHFWGLFLKESGQGGGI